MKYEVVISELEEYIKLTDDDNIVYFIPFDENNKDYQEYLKWKENNN